MKIEFDSETLKKATADDLEEALVMIRVQIKYITAKLDLPTRTPFDATEFKNEATRLSIEEQAVLAELASRREP